MKLFLLSAVVAASVAFLLGRFLGTSGAPKSKPAETAAQPVAPPTVVVATEPLTAARQLRAAPENLEKRLGILSLIGQADTDEKIMGLLRDLEGDEAAEESLVAHWAQRDPAACLQWLRKQRYDVNHPGFHKTRALFRTWAATDAGAAWAAAMKERTRPGYGDAAFEVIETAMQHSLEEGGKLLAQLPEFPTMYFFPKNLWETDPASLVKVAVPAGRVPDKSLVNALQEPLQAWSKKDPAATLAWLQSLPQEAAGPLLVYAMDGLGTHDPTAAASLISQLPSAAMREAATEHLVRGWITKDPAAALLFAAQQMGPRRNAALTEITNALALNGSATMLQTVGGITDAKARGTLLPILARAWLDNDHPQATHWLASLPPSPERTDVLNAVANKWAENAPDSALRFLRQDADPSLDDLYRKCIIRGINVAPMETMPLILAQPPERVLPGIRAAYNLMSTEYQLEDATALLATLPMPEYRTEAVRSFMEPFATGMRLFDEGVAWGAALPPGPLRNVARDTLLNSPLLTPKELARAKIAFQ